MTPQQLRAARQWLGLTQSALADRLGVDWRTIARWEGGRTIPKIAQKAIELLLAQPPATDATRCK